MDYRARFRSRKKKGMRYGTQIKPSLNRPLVNYNSSVSGVGVYTRINPRFMLNRRGRRRSKITNQRQRIVRKNVSTHAVSNMLSRKRKNVVKVKKRLPLLRLKNIVCPRSLNYFEKCYESRISGPHKPHFLTERIQQISIRNENSCSFYLIPNEVLFIILTMMDYRSILRFKLVTKRFCDLSNSSQVKKMIRSRKNGRKSKLKRFKNLNVEEIDNETLRGKVERLRYFYHKNRLRFLIVNTKNVLDSIVFRPKNVMKNLNLREDLPGNMYAEDIHIGYDVGTLKFTSMMCGRFLDINSEHTLPRIVSSKNTDTSTKFGMKVWVKKGNGLVRYGKGQKSTKKDYWGECELVFDVKDFSVNMFCEGRIIVKKCY